MKRILSLLIFVLIIQVASSQMKAPGVKWDETYTYKKIFGEVWITDEVKLSNDYGIFRAAKMAALHNTLSVGGFVMEMTTEDNRGGKTLMKTISLQNSESYTADFKNADMTTAINKVNYYTF